MIRREILLADGVPRWLLVSQLEHARLSGLLAEHCLAHFARSARGDAVALNQVRDELLRAIYRHDDGWAEWEARPGINPQLHQPLSFRELPLDEALENWEGSITSAAEAGPLAAWTVAGHFAALLESSDEQHEKFEASRWLARTADQRAAWLAKWQSLNVELHTKAIAAEALVWLQAFDLISLWLTAVCPTGGEIVRQWPADCLVAPGQPIEMRLHADGAADNSRQTKVVITPWHFDVPEISVECASCVAPVREYQDSDELLRNCRPHELRWSLVPT